MTPSYLMTCCDTPGSRSRRLRARHGTIFDIDLDLQDASVRRIQVVGEATRMVSETFKNAHPEIPWDKITGMRHRMVHNYRRIDLEVVWRVVTLHLPPLIESLEKIDLK